MNKSQKYINSIGLIFGYIIILDYKSIELDNKKNCFKALCVCGKEFYPNAYLVINGRTKSCGCKRYELQAISKMKTAMSGNLNIIKHVFNIYKHHAIEKKLDFPFTLENIRKFIFNDCGLGPSNKFENNGKGINKIIKYNAWNGIDRKNNDIGYNLDNCVTCCNICNLAKKDLPFNEFISYIERICIFNGFIKN